MSIESISGYLSFNSDNYKWSERNSGRSSKVLLHECERCGECGKTYLSLYPLSQCKDHAGLDKI